jgi:hypothetical protein
MIPRLEMPHLHVHLEGLNRRLYDYPHERAAVIATERNITLDVLGITADQKWLLVDYEGQALWLLNLSNLGTLEGDPALLTVVDYPPILVQVRGLARRLYAIPIQNDAFLVTTVQYVALPVTATTPDQAWLQVDYEGQSLWLQNIPNLNALSTLSGSLNALPQIGYDQFSGVRVKLGSLLRRLYTQPDNTGAVRERAAEVTLPVLATTPDQNWLLVVYGGQQLWLENISGLNQIEGDLNSLPVIAP